MGRLYAVFPGAPTPPSLHDDSHLCASIYFYYCPFHDVLESSTYTSVSLVSLEVSHLSYCIWIYTDPALGLAQSSDGINKHIDKGMKKQEREK